MRPPRGGEKRGWWMIVPCARVKKDSRIVTKTAFFFLSVRKNSLARENRENIRPSARSVGRNGVLAQRRILTRTRTLAGPLLRDWRSLTAFTTGEMYARKERAHEKLPSSPTLHRPTTRAARERKDSGSQSSVQPLPRMYRVTREWCNNFC